MIPIDRNGTHNLVSFDIPLAFKNIRYYLAKEKQLTDRKKTHNRKYKNNGSRRMTYRFSCRKCNAKFDVRMTLKEFTEYKNGLRKITCPVCKSGDTKNVICAVGVNLGEGFTRRAF